MNQRLAYQLGGIGVGLFAMVYACVSSRHARLSRMSREAHVRKFDTDADSDDSALRFWLFIFSLCGSVFIHRRGRYLPDCSSRLVLKQHSPLVRFVCMRK